MQGAEKAKNEKLVTYLEKRRQEMARESPPRQISGLQFVWLVKRFFMIHDTERVQYELSPLMDLTYPGDGKLDSWKNNVDHMLRNMRTPIDDKDKYGILKKKLVGS